MAETFVEFCVQVDSGDGRAPWLTLEPTRDRSVAEDALRWYRPREWRARIVEREVTVSEWRPS